MDYMDYMKIQWIGQSGYIIQTAATKIVIDPYLSDAVNRVAGRARMVAAPIKPENLTADAVICTHNHLDHLDVDAVKDMPANTHFITTGEGSEMLHSLGQNNVSVLRIGDCISIGDIEIIAVYAKHTVEAFGVILKAEGQTWYFSGDTLFDEKLYEIAAYQPDMTFICINGKLGNMNVEEAVCVAKHIGAKLNVPNHYGMFASNTEDPYKFTNQLHGGFILEYNQAYYF